MTRIFSFDTERSWTGYLLPLKEYQENNKNMVIEDCNMKQTVYMYKSNGCTLQVKGKINSITLGMLLTLHFYREKFWRKLRWVDLK